MYSCACAMAHILRSENNYQESIPFFDQDPGIELRWLGLVASAFTHWTISLVHKDILQPGDGGSRL